MTKSTRDSADRPGAALLAWLTAEFEFNPVEQELAEAAAGCLDRVAELRHQLEADGLVVPGSMKQPRAHPALGEIRAELDLFVRLVRAIQLPPAEEHVALRVAK